MTATSPAPNIHGRYGRQVLFSPIGAAGQERIAEARVTVIGVGALGTVIAANLCRAGVGHLRLVDRDIVELSNLHRQLLFREEDARRRLPKASAAAQALSAVNSNVRIEPVVADVSSRNVKELVAGSSVVLDGTDNLETRFLVNDACLQADIPWVYGGAVGARGTTLTIVPGDTACLRCLIPQLPPPGTMPNCDTEGVIAAITGVIGSVEACEALKLLVGEPPRRTWLCVDLWEGDFRDLGIARQPDCPACVRRDYEFLSGSQESWTTVLCGRNTVQIVPPTEQGISLEALARRLGRIGKASYNGFVLSFEVADRELVVFPTGRTLVRGTSDEAEARSLFARYVGA